MWAWLAWQGWPTGTLLQCFLHSGVGMLVAALVMGRWLHQRLGGYTGDGLGASQQLAELAGLLGWLLVIHPA